MGSARRRSRDRRHHRLRTVAARRCRLCRAAGNRSPGREGQGGCGGGIGQGGQRSLRARFGRDSRDQRDAYRRTSQGQCRPDGRRLVHQASPRRPEGTGRPDGCGGLQALYRGATLMRYLPLTDRDRGEMLAAIGVDSIDTLFADVPGPARLDGLVDLPKAMGEIEVERAISRMAARNVAAGSVPFFIGGGAYRHHIPAAVDHLIQRGEFLTSYTPYQPELAQGTLQYLFEFQTQIALLTAMEVANASLYDGATACAEAVAMAGRVTG